VRCAFAIRDACDVCVMKRVRVRGLMRDTRACVRDVCGDAHVGLLRVRRVCVLLLRVRATCAVIACACDVRVCVSVRCAV
jgi:hypothetical protein